MDAQPQIDPPTPVPLQWITAGVFVLVGLYVALPLAMALNRDETAQSIRVRNPSLDPSHLDFAVNAVLAYTVVLHAIDVVLAVWLVLKVRAGRRWARITLTAYLIVVTLASYISWEAGPQFRWAVISTALIHVVMLGLLWLPASMRDFFAGHRDRTKEPAGHATAH